ncbi:MAG: hypothetical protein JWQ35_2742, partial [Bacteriovoracaceae bacterium]|nr:hypothetical protein [Bacteriovoracaceae bacterium]
MIKNYLIILPLFVSLSVFADVKVEKIVIDPPDQTSIVASILPFHVNDTYDPKFIEISNRLLTSTNKFDRAEISWSEATGTMVIQVVPKLFFENILWRGEGPLRTDELRQMCIQTYEPRLLTQDRISQMSQCLLREIRGKGYLDVQLNLSRESENLKIEVQLGAIYTNKEINFLGNDKVPDAELAENIVNREGQPFLSSKLEDDTKTILKTYFNEGFYFAEVFKPVLKIDPDTKRVTITWKVKESYPMNIQFTGRRKSRKPLYQFIEREQTFPAWFLDEIVDDMKASLKEDGYLSPEISVTKTINDRDVEDVDIHTRVGPRFHLVEPEWIGVGNKFLVQKFYHTISDLNEGSAFHEAEFRNLLSETFIPNLISHGYLDAKLRNLDFVIDREKGLVRPVIYMNEGDLFRVKDSNVEGVPKELSRIQELKDLEATLKRGSAYDSITVEKLQKDLQRRLVEFGYLDASTEKKSVNTDNELSVSIKVVPGIRYRVAKVLIRGAIKTDYNVLKREVLLSPGDYYEDERIKDSISQILRLGIARSVDIQVLEKDAAKGEVYVLVD